MYTNKKKYFKFSFDFSFKFFLGIVLCLLVRLIPFRAPNVEPILAATMPMGRAFGAFAGFSFGVLSILLYDLITNTLGVHTFFTAGTYGLLGLWSVNYFKNKKADAWSYVKFAIMGTLFYDAMTGLTIGPIFFHQSFFQAFFGQIPFTVLHLAGNIVFACVLSPGIYNFLIRKKKKESPALIINTLNPITN